jgi:YihY family inner membrane protein
MSTASVVPETWELTGDDATEVLRSHGRRHLLRDAFMRLRVADGFSHARSMAYATTLLMVEATIAVVGLAVAIGDNGTSRLVVRTMRAAVPGPGGDLLTSAVEQAHRAGTSQRYTGLIFGLVAALITGSTLMGQLERGLNRIYGVEQDRPTLKKYGLALALTVSAGALAVASFALLAFGQAIGDSINNDTANRIWGVARWPVALVLVTAMMTILFRYSPRRHQPAFSWLAFSGFVATMLWWVVTAGLGLFFTLSTSFGETYGPLAGLVALMLWALLSAVAVLFGGAVGAQLEAIRAGVTQPQDAEKVEESEPSSAPRREGFKVSA